MAGTEHGGPATIDHLGFLRDVEGIPPYLLPADGGAAVAHYSCAFCGVGDSGAATTAPLSPVSSAVSSQGIGLFRVRVEGRSVECAGYFSPDGQLQVESDARLANAGEIVVGELVIGGRTTVVVGQEVGTRILPDGASHTFVLTSAAVSTARTTIVDKQPTSGCVKLRISLGEQRCVFPIHIEPSALRPSGVGGGREALGYTEAIARFADLLLAHRPPSGRTLFYACGQIDYFTVFAVQEVLRLLGVRNLAGNAEHCLNAGAVHNEMLTGQEGPFLTIEQGLAGPGRFYLLNGWNGFITHPPAFQRLLKRPDLDAYLVEVARTESAEALARRLGPGRVLFIRPGGDPHLALAVAHEILRGHPGRVDQRFVDRYADRGTFDRYVALAGSDRFSPEAVAARLAPEPGEEANLLLGIRRIAAGMAAPGAVPINIPSVGLSQTKGAVAHCLWGDALALVGRYGLRPDGSPAGGTLRLPGQINAQTEVQGLSRRVFMGRIPVDAPGAVEAARRMGLPDGAYAPLVDEPARAALDYSDPSEDPELFVCFGTQFESNMMERDRWVRKLESPAVRLVVVDPVPDPFTLERPTW